MPRFITTLTAASVAALVAGGALAQSAETELERAGNAVEAAGDNLAEAAGNAADAAGEAAGDAMQAAETTAERAGEAVGDAAEATEEAVAGAGAKVMDMMDAESIDMANVVRARDLQDQTVYTTSADAGSWDTPDASYATIDDDHNAIGEVEDILFDNRGRMVGIVAEIGGFLDIGDKHVVISTDELRVARNGEDYVFLVRLTEEELETRESVDEGWWQ